MATLASSTAQQTQKGGHTRTNKHKKRTGTKTGTRGRTSVTQEAELRTQKHDMAAHIYHASDGFTGTYDQVKAHEDAHGLHWNAHGGHDPPPHELHLMGSDAEDKHDMAAHIYHASDGFTGTYDQVKAHEDAHGLHWNAHGGHDPPPHELHLMDGDDTLAAHIYHASGT